MTTSKTATHTHSAALESPPRRARTTDTLENALHLHQSGEMEQAQAAYGRLLQKEPQNPHIARYLGILHMQSGRPAEAISCFERAIALDPGFTEAHSNLGSALREAGLPEQAAAAFRKAIEIDSGLAAAHFNLGNALKEMNDDDGAVACFRNALALAPDHAGARCALGIIHKENGRSDKALACFRETAKIAPEMAQPWNHMGDILLKQGDTDQAMDSYERALAVEPEDGEALGNLIWMRREICDWSQWRSDANLLDQTIDRRLERGDAALIDPFAALILTASPERQRHIARATAGRLAQKAALPHAPKKAAPPRHGGGNNERLRLGYLSADFHAHATAYLMCSLFALHDRNAFEVFAYSYGPDDNSEVRARIRRESDHFIDLSALSDHNAARRIADDGIHILLDLKGFTENTRLGIPALRPAPLQVAYLGFPGSMQADFMDYIIADHWVIPEGAQDEFSETPVYMPHSYQVNDHLRRRADPGLLTRTTAGLPRGAFVYCCFNNSFKIDPDIFHTWMRILNSVPDGVLWLLEASPRMSANLRDEAGKQGIDPERMVFAGRAPHEEHLARHHLADLFLDTPVYNAHTTASDALYEGLPLLTCPGDSFARRVGASLAHAVEMPEMIVESLAEYEERAIALGRDRGAARRLRETLGGKLDSCPLFDTPRFARDLERAFAEMWKAHQSGGPLRAIDVATVTAADAEDAG